MTNASDNRARGALLDPSRFDDEFGHVKSSRIIWTLGGIAARIGVGPDFVRDTLMKQPGSPIHEIGGRYYAFEEDLIAFLRGGSKRD